MMMPATYNFSAYRGDTQRWSLVLWQDANRTVPVNLTGCTVAAQIRDQPGGILITPITCAVTLPQTVALSVTGAASALLYPGPCAWDLQITQSNGDIGTPISGTITVIGDVTTP